MGKWQVSKLKEKKTTHTDRFIEQMYGESVTTQNIQREQTFKNQNATQVVKNITLHEKRNVNTKKLESRTITVEFGSVLPFGNLNKILGQRKLDQISEKEYKLGKDFNANRHRDVVIILSTLHDISPFSDEMKTAIVDYFGSNMQESEKQSLRSNLFNKFTKVPSLFTLSMRKLQEHCTVKEIEDLTAGLEMKK